MNPAMSCKQRPTLRSGKARHHGLQERLFTRAAASGARLVLAWRPPGVGMAPARCWHGARQVCKGTHRKETCMTTEDMTLELTIKSYIKAFINTIKI